MRALERRGMVGNGALHRPAPAPANWLGRAHDRTYVDQVIACAVPAKIEREIGFPVGERVSLRAQLATGGTILAATAGAGARHCLQHGRRQPPCAARPGRWLLHVQRCGGRGADAAGRRAGGKHSRDRSRRASGRRHGRYPARRAARLHLFHARRAQLSGAQDESPVWTSPCRTAWPTTPISSGWPTFCRR